MWRGRGRELSDFSISAFFFLSTNETFFPAEKLFAQASCDPPTEFVVSRAGDYEVQTVHTFNLECTH